MYGATALSVRLSDRYPEDCNRAKIGWRSLPPPGAILTLSDATSAGIRGTMLAITDEIGGRACAGRGVWCLPLARLAFMVLGNLLPGVLP